MFNLTRRAVFSTMAVLGLSTALVNPTLAQSLDVEKDELKLGFIKLTDMAPLAVAYDKVILKMGVCL
mgnify:CR=1 FL=1